MQRRTLLFRVVGLVCLFVGLAVAVVAVAAFPYPDTPFLSRKGEGSTTEANEYYAEISAPATFALWYSAYFPAGGDRADAIYYNAGDLGFGREMHCREEPNFTSCYVVNHGLGPGAPADLAVNDAVANARILPIVAMVYDYTIEGQPNDVSFYVYAPNGALINQVGLDSEGDKNVPHLCLPCHGGTYDETSDSVTGANFLPFDADSFGFSTAPGFTLADQEEDIRLLNRFVDYTFPAADIGDLITGWYTATGGVYTTGAVLDNSYVPAAWDTSAEDRELYNEVVKDYCRACHIAQDYRMDVPSQLDSAFYPVFESNEMPHTEMTAHNFWSSSAPAILARRFVGTGQTFRVTTTADTVPNGCDSVCTLREAVIAANADIDMSVIVFDVNGTFTMTQSGSDDTGVLGDLDITEDLYILGNGPALTDLNANLLDRYFHMKFGAEVVIQGVTIRGGSSVAGAGIRNDGGTLTLNRSVVRNNNATVSGGGGLANLEFGTAYINQSTFSANTTDDVPGGAIYNEESTVEVNDSTLSGNSASEGGAVYSAFGSSANLRHVTVVLNNASVTGGGIATDEGSYTNVGFSIVAGNLSAGHDDCFVGTGNGATHNSEGYNLRGPTSGAGSCPTVGTDLTLSGALSAVLDTNLQTDPATGITYHAPRGGSPVLDAIPLGAFCQTPSYDARNIARPRDGNSNGVLGCDIGAIEVFARAVYLPLVAK